MKSRQKESKLARAVLCVGWAVPWPAHKTKLHRSEITKISLLIIKKFMQIFLGTLPLSHANASPVQTVRSSSHRRCCLISPTCSSTSPSVSSPQATRPHRVHLASVLLLPYCNLRFLLASLFDSYYILNNFEALCLFYQF